MILGKKACFTKILQVGTNLALFHLSRLLSAVHFNKLSAWGIVRCSSFLPHSRTGSLNSCFSPGFRGLPLLLHFVQFPSVTLPSSARLCHLLLSSIGSSLVSSCPVPSVPSPVASRGFAEPAGAVGAGAAAQEFRNSSPVLQCRHTQTSTNQPCLNQTNPPHLSLSHRAVNEAIGLLPFKNTQTSSFSLSFSWACNTPRFV